MLHRFSFSGKRFGGFTLIELLIVVAIIAILAAIAVPNFIEAQVRAKVSRAKADMRSLATAIESYAVDNNKYPDAILVGPTRLLTSHSRASLELLSTPISYITNAKLDDPFATSNPLTQFFGYANCQAMTVMDLVVGFAATGGTGMADTSPGPLNAFAEKRYLMQSVGPDETNYAQSPFPPPSNAGFARAYTYLSEPQKGDGYDFLYDPTNGTVSKGDVVRTGAGPLN